MIRAGLVGLGEIGQVHLRAQQEAPQVELTAVCDHDAALLAQAGKGMRAYAGYDELLADGALDVIDICLPHALHEPFALRALESGRHVLLEKPMAVSVEQCDRIMAAAERHGRTVGVSHNQLFYEPHRRLRAMIEGGELGALRTIRARLAIGGRYGAWRADPEIAGGGLLIDAGVHRLYTLELLGGEVRSVAAVMDRPRAEGAYGLVLELATGAIGVIDACYHGPPGAFDDRVEVVGERALAEVPGCEAHFEGFARGPDLRVWRDGVWREESSGDSWAESVKRSVRGYMEALERGSEPPVTGAAGRRTVAVIEAAYRAAESGARVELGPAR